MVPLAILAAFTDWRIIATAGRAVIESGPRHGIAAVHPTLGGHVAIVLGPLGDLGIAQGLRGCLVLVKLTQTIRTAVAGTASIWVGPRLGRSISRYFHSLGSPLVGKAVDFH